MARGFLAPGLLDCGARLGMNPSIRSPAAPPQQVSANDEAWSTPPGLPGADGPGQRNSERRAVGVQRVPLARVVDVCGLLPGAPSFRAHSVDVSRRGIQLKSELLPEVATPVVLRFQQNGCAVIAEGEVAWRQRNEVGGEFGVRFTALDVHSAEALRGLGASPLNPDLAPTGGRQGRPRAPAPPPPPNCEAPFTPAPPESAPRCGPPSLAPKGALARAGAPRAEDCVGALPSLALGSRSDEVPPLCNAGVATSVCLRVDGFDAPLAATVTERSGQRVRVASPLPFLTLGQAVDILEDQSAPRAAHVEAVSLSVDPETHVPELHLALSAPSRPADCEPPTVGSGRSSSGLADPTSSRPARARAEPSSGSRADLTSQAAAREQAGGTERARAPFLPRSRSTAASASGAPAASPPPSAPSSRPLRAPSGAAGASSSVPGRPVVFPAAQPPPGGATRSTRSERGRLAGGSARRGAARPAVEVDRPRVSEIEAASTASPGSAARSAPRGTRDTEPPRAGRPAEQEEPALARAGNRLRGWLAARGAKPSLNERAAEPALRRTAAAPPRSVTSALGVAAARGEPSTTSSALGPDRSQQAAAARRSRLAQGVVVLLLLVALLVGLSRARRAPSPAEGTEAPVAAVASSSPKASAPGSVGSGRTQGVANAAAGHPANAAQTSRVFARGRLHLPVVHRLRLDRPGHALVGKVTPLGFEVFIPDRQLVDPADAIAARDQRVTHVIARREAGGTRLLVRFAGSAPAFKVRLRESRLEVLLSAEP